MAMVWMLIITKIQIYKEIILNYLKIKLIKYGLVFYNNFKEIQMLKI